MAKTVGPHDRALIGVALIALAFTLLTSDGGQWVAAIAAAAVSVRPAYRLLGLRSCPIDA